MREYIVTERYLNPYRKDNDFGEIIRCKDCIHLFDGERVPNCCEKLMEKCGWVIEIPVDNYWFCADGERKEE